MLVALPSTSYSTKIEYPVVLEVRFYRTIFTGKP